MPTVREALDCFAANLRSFRKERGFTQEQLAAHLELDPRFVQKLEAARARPSFATIVLAAETLGVPIGNLFVPAVVRKRPRGRPRRG